MYKRSLPVCLSYVHVFISAIGSYPIYIIVPLILFGKENKNS